MLLKSTIISFKMFIFFFKKMCLIKLFCKNKQTFSSSFDSSFLLKLLEFTNTEFECSLPNAPFSMACRAVDSIEPCQLGPEIGSRKMGDAAATVFSGTTHRNGVDWANCLISFSCVVSLA
uniref:(northern house mosquito) hypothetical protein n=1 Tax=Culex pipiens TaxID=7175 RepID=A0A8D8E527_CULPI